MELESGGKMNDKATVPHKNNESQVTCDLKLGFLVKIKKERKERNRSRPLNDPSSWPSQPHKSLPGVHWC